MNDSKNNWLVHVEWVVVLITLLGGFYLLNEKIDQQRKCTYMLYKIYCKLQKNSNNPFEGIKSDPWDQVKLDAFDQIELDFWDHYESEFLSKKDKVPEKGCRLSCILEIKEVLR